jgi:hypothetical protein
MGKPFSWFRILLFFISIAINAILLVSIPVFADHGAPPPPPVSPLVWNDLTLLDWTGQISNPISRPFLTCGRNSSSSLWRILQTSDNQIIASGFASFESCYRSVQSAKPDHLCLPSAQQAGKFYLRRLSDGQRVGNYFVGQEQCLSMINEVRKQLICMPSERHRGKFYLHSLTANRGQNEYYFSDANSCNQSLSRIHTGFQCLPSTRSAGKYFLHRPGQQWPSNGSNPFFSDLNACNGSIDSEYAGYICVDSKHHAGKAYLLNFEDGKKIGQNFSSLMDCQSNLRSARKKYICMPSSNAEKFYIINLRDATPIHPSVYFSDANTCQISVQNMASDFICVPSKHRPGKYHLYDWVKQTIQNGFYDDQAQCLMTLEPWVSYERQNCIYQQQLPSSYGLHVLENAASGL